MAQAQAGGRRLCVAERTALASFLAGRLPAGQLHAALLRARDPGAQLELVPLPSIVVEELPPAASVDPYRVMALGPYDA